MGLLSFVTDIFSPAKELIDELHYSGEEKAALKQKIFEAEIAMSAKVLDYETRKMELQAEVIKVEGTGESWLQRNWRPLLMVTVASILANNYVLVPWLHAVGASGAPILELPDGLWNLLTVGVGGYIVGRTAEKTSKQWSINIGGNKLGKESEVK